MGHPVWATAGAAAVVVLLLTGVFIVRLRRPSSALCDDPGGAAG